MVWWILAGFLSAFGMLCIIWVILGRILPGTSGGFWVCRGSPGFPERAFVWRYLYLAEAGIIRCPLLVLDRGLEECDRQWLLQYEGRIEICMPEECVSRLELERNEFG